MKRFFRNFFSLSAISVLLALLLLKTVTPVSNVSATNQGGDSCNQETTYEKSSDYDDSRVNINFQDGDEAITVTAKSGYQLVSVQLDVENDGQGGFVTYPVVNGVKFNPNPGSDIDEAKVKVKKVCASPTPTATPTPTNTPTPTVTVSPTPTDTPRVTPTPTSTVCPDGQIYSQGLQICISCPGDGECEVVIGDLSPTPTLSEEPTPTPTQAPSSNSGSTGGSTNNDPGTVTVQSAVEEKKGAVNSPTLPATGNSGSILATIEQALGLALASLGVVYGKKKSLKKKSK